MRGEGEGMERTCEDNGHLYTPTSNGCIFCGQEPSDWAKCQPVCSAYELEICRCWKMDQPPASAPAAGGE